MCLIATRGNQVSDPISTGNPNPKLPQKFAHGARTARTYDLSDLQQWEAASEKEGTPPAATAEMAEVVGMMSYIAAALRLHVPI